MSVHCPTPKKFIGTPAAMVAYYAENSNDAALKAVTSYYAHPKDGVVFQHVGGRAAARLGGLDLSIGLTREQHAEIHNGRWNGVQLTKGRYSPVWEMDERGHPVKAQNPATGKFEKVPVLELAVDDDGQPVLDPLTGQQALRMKTESATVAGYDIPCTLDKSWAELVIAHPELTDLVRSMWLQAVMTGNEWTQDHAELVVTKIDGNKEKHKAELIWWTVIGNAARPTKETTERGYGADPHLHAHTFLSSTAYVEGLGWRKIDGEQLYQLSQQRGQVISLTMNKLMEDAGLKIDYALDRKGNYFSQIAGSNEVARDFFSTNRNRLYDLQWQFERKYGRKPTHQELDQLRAETKVKKSKLAKEADELGNLEQVERWRAALDAAGIELTIADIGAQVERPRDSKQELYQRLESPGGVGRDIQSAAVFGPEVVYPTVIRSAEGLGYNIDELEPLANEYIANELVVMRDAVDPRHRLYTTKTILRGEEVIAERLEQMAGRSFRAVPEHVLAAELRSLRFSLDPDQERAVRAVCGTDGVVHVTGRAGSGKTSALRPAVSALRKAGLVDQVIVVSVAAKRAKETGQDIGADKSWSVEALERAMTSKNAPKMTDKTLVIFDEAGMGNTFEISKTLQLVDGARWVDVGDSKQAQSIGAGGHYEVELAKRGSVELTRNYRQNNHKDVEAWNLLREGDGHGCVANLHERKRIFVADHPEDLVTEVQTRYEHYLDRGYTPAQIGIVNTGSNLELDAMNRMAQRVLIERGQIDELAAFDVVEQSTGRMWRLHGGDRIVFNKGYWFNTDYSTAPILNGTTGIIERLDNDGRTARLRLSLDTEDRRQVTVVLAKESNVQPIGVGYAMSQTKFQGGEVDIAIVLPGNAGIADLNSGYSATTRGRDVTEIVIDRDTWGEYPLQKLGEAWSRETPKEQASAYAALWDDYAQEREQEMEGYGLVNELSARIEAMEQSQQGQSFGRGIGLN